MENIFIAVKKENWGYGIGTILLEEVLHWVREIGLLSRLELTVQVQQSRVPLQYIFIKLGFQIEGTQYRGARTDQGEWLDLYYMGMLIGDP